jgi:hypothetical protein
MPYKITKTDHKFKVSNKDTGAVHAKGTSKANAEAQVRLLQGVKHGMVPRTTTQVAGLHEESKTHAKAHKASRGKK